MVLQIVCVHYSRKRALEAFIRFLSSTPLAPSKYHQSGLFIKESKFIPHVSMNYHKPDKDLVASQKSRAEAHVRVCLRQVLGQRDLLRIGYVCGMIVLRLLDPGWGKDFKDW